LYTKRECEYGPGEWPRECGTCAHYRKTNKSGTCRIIVPSENNVEEEMVCKFHVMVKR
jgi:hypothetical protein